MANQCTAVMKGTTARCRLDAGHAGYHDPFAHREDPVPPASAPAATPGLSEIIEQSLADAGEETDEVFPPAANERDPYFVLAFCQNAIQDALTLEDGLDAAVGASVLTMIDRAIASRPAATPEPETLCECGFPYREHRIGYARSRCTFRPARPTGEEAETLVEQVSAKVHDNWMAAKRAAGVESRKLESGEELMVPYDQLSEAAKELDRGTVRTVLAALPEPAGVEDGASLIAAERERQKAVEGWTPEHDAQYTDRSLAKAAACYVRHYAYDAYGFGHVLPASWPPTWERRWWKPDATNPIRDLVRAGALIAAEIDRLRAALAPRQPTGDQG